MIVIIEEDLDMSQVEVINQFIEDSKLLGINLELFIRSDNEVTKPIKVDVDDIEFEKKFYGQTEEE